MKTPSGLPTIGTVDPQVTSTEEPAARGLAALPLEDQPAAVTHR